MIFASDLDNTLIYSYKHKIGPKRLVETMGGRELSYMTLWAYETLQKLNREVIFIPVTTRSIEQYGRIRLLKDGACPSFALTDNGGNLLADGRPDTLWRRETMGLIEEAEGELEKGRSLLERDSDRSFEVRTVDGMFLFTKSNQPEETADRLRQVLDLEAVGVFTNGVKVYVVPRALNKGTALRRLRKRELAVGQPIVAAGDSSFDVEMLLEADLGICPFRLYEEEPRLRQAADGIWPVEEGPVFSDEVLRIVEQYQSMLKQKEYPKNPRI